MRRLTILLILISASLLSPAPSGAQTVSECLVDRVIDGDTVVLNCESRRVIVRLIGVDTPETVHPRKPVEPDGPAATRFLKNLLSGERVRAQFAARPDKYRRALAYLYRADDALLINREIIRQGYGRVYTKSPFALRGEFIALEADARRHRRGLWAAGQ